MTRPALLSRTNVVPSAYRGVSVSHVPDAARAHKHVLGREAYRRTRFIVARDDAGATALLRVEKESTGPLFAPIVDVEVLAGPDECAYVVDPEADTAVPSELARVATGAGAAGPPAAAAGGAATSSTPRAVVVKGRYEHVSFIVNPAPLRLVVQEVLPPEPAKLLDQVRRLLAVAEHLPPILPEADPVTFADLAAQAAAPRYLLPCGGSGVAVDGAATAYLDQRPPRQPWTLLGCARSRDIHEWFYGDRPPSVEMCPRARPHDAGTAVITKCCLLEDHIERDGDRVVVPWGASLGQVGEALREIAARWEPEWRPV